MVVVAVALAAWILVVLWQDKRTAHLDTNPLQPNFDSKAEGDSIEMRDDAVDKNLKGFTVKTV